MHMLMKYNDTYSNTYYGCSVTTLLGHGGNLL